MEEPDCENSTDCLSSRFLLLNDAFPLAIVIVFVMVDEIVSVLLVIFMKAVEVFD